LTNPTAVREVAVEMARTLLYLEDDYNMPEFAQRMPGIARSICLGGGRAS
jgi:hypothetical protein